MNTYEQLDVFLGRKIVRNVPGIRATKVVRLDVAIAVVYHNTAVVIASSDHTYKLNTAGYRTATTKDRINTYSPAHLYQKDFKWFLGSIDGAGCDQPFRDGIRVDANGNVIGG